MFLICIIYSLSTIKILITIIMVDLDEEHPLLSIQSFAVLSCVLLAGVAVMYIECTFLIGDLVKNHQI